MFASLQSEPGRKALAALEQQQAGIPDSIVLFDNGKYYIRSSAALRIAGIMRYPWAGLQIFSILPKVVRDSMYNIIARNRYKWFGKSESCPLPTPELKARMIT
jgi:predicted DCC family thiol-disulfide oxidoreductase YuxK